MTYKVVKTKSEEYCEAEALLLGLEYDPKCHWYRVREGPSNFTGCANYHYICAETHKQVVEMRSELDQPWSLQRRQR